MNPLETKIKSIFVPSDQANPKEAGKPFYFDLDLYIASIEMMIASDEIQTAIYMCDNPPGWYRDNYPKELEEIKNTLYKNCYDQFDYASDHDEANYSLEEINEQCLSHYTYPRANILYEDIKGMNEKDEVPFVFEISPSHGWLPLGFASRGLRFNFFGKNLNQPALRKIKDWLPDGVWSETPKEGQHKALVCFEALEHMWNPHDLEQAAKKTGFEFDSIYLSTPKYTLGGGLPNWKTRRIGHIRTWTPKEFLDFASKSFPGYRWKYYDSFSMVIKGEKGP